MPACLPFIEFVDKQVKCVVCLIVQAAVMDIQVVSNGFLTCGGDGVVKSVRFQERFPW